ncbi:MAG TPA: valine--tRNA ligase [Ruminococcaceae bacterium]|nr:valine--tRNA ligase [Oscillospiraceae bacterium]
MPRELSKSYNPGEIEAPLYKEWCEKGYFTPSPDKNKQHFTIVIPPPNVTGQLHMGHALDESMQDTIIRYKRMQGFCTLWVPGTDHAGIATQIKVEEMLRKEQGLSRYDLGREKFVDTVWEWKHKYGNRIISQLKALGSSCDWTRERFTMDENLSAAVKKVFVSLYNDGLIYRGFRISNICPRCETALSDAEVEHSDKEGAFWHIRYPYADGSGEIIIATTRPETLLGDTAVAVNPDDERYKDKIGKKLILPLVGREIPVIADEYVEKEFGTGAVKITPAHDPNDFEVGARHNLDTILVIDTKGKITEAGGKYAGLDRYEARKQIVADLEAQGYLVKIEKYTHSVGHCCRCGTVVEPLASRQWFVKMAPLAKKAIEVVEDGTTDFIPERFSKIYMNWMNGIHDWCISRQLWWGHRIPAYYCDDCGEMTVSETDVTVCPKCGGTHVHQDEDVLDTWFSSALWSFSTLGWPNKTEDLDYFYPTSVLITGYDIITFWVSRMITMGMYCMNEKPFDHVMIHGLVRDSQGRKMSKSLGNGIDPLEIIDKCGADALRFALLTGNSPGNDMRFSDEKIEAARNFNNKLWNAARFILMNLTVEKAELPDTDRLETEDRWILSKYNRLVSEVTVNLENYELGVALAKLYDFTWDIFCDWYIELVKPRLSSGDENAQQVLIHVITGILKMLHPFIPFITEEIWQSLPHDGESIMISDWPKYSDALCFDSEEASMGAVIDAIRAIRNRRQEMNVPPSRKAALTVVTDRTDIFNEKSEKFFIKLASASSMEVVRSYASDTAVQIVTSAATIFIPLAEIVDIAKEKARLEAELKKNDGEILRLVKKLDNPGFIANAPEAVVAGEKAKLAKYRETAGKIKAALEKIK